MIEQYLQVALELFKEIWFQLNSILGLEETAAFKLIKLYLIEIQDTPTYMVIAFAMLILILLGLYKIRSIAQERERKVEKLMEEMDKEEYDEIHMDTRKFMGDSEEEFKLEPISPELLKPNLKKDLNEFQRSDFDIQDRNNETINDPEPKKNYSIDDKSEREPESLMSRLKDLQEILDTGFGHEKIGDTSPTVESNIHSADDPLFLEQQNFTPKSPKVTSKDNKKYIEALESLIFLKDQKKH